MAKKRITQRAIGFTQGVAYAAALMKRAQMDAESLLKESGIPAKDFGKYADDFDLDYLNEILDDLETK